MKKKMKENYNLKCIEKIKNMTGGERFIIDLNTEDPNEMRVWLNTKQVFLWKS